MLLNNRRLRRRNKSLLLEGATIDNLDMSTSEVKDTVEELEDDLTNDIPPASSEDEVSNGEIQNGGLDGDPDEDQIPTDVTVENAVIFLKEGYSGNRYYVNMRDVLAIQEAAAEEEVDDSGSEDDDEEFKLDEADEGEGEGGGDNEETPAAGPEVEPAQADTQASDVIEQIADANGIDKEDVTVVIQAKECARIAQAALCEEAVGHTNGYYQRHLRALKAAVDDLQMNGIHMVRK